MRRCVFALGSNLGDRLAMLESACDYNQHRNSNLHIFCCQQS